MPLYLNYCVDVLVNLTSICIQHLKRAPTAFVSTIKAMQQNKRVIVISGGSCPVTRKMKYLPPLVLCLCEILAAVYVHCHVKDDRSCLP